MAPTLEPWAMAALVGVGLTAGFLNVVGGGGSLLTMPLLIFLGLPPNTANGTARVAIFVQNAAALWKYRREGQLSAATVRALVPPALLGAAIGAAVASRLPQAGFVSLLGWVMLGAAVLVVASPTARFRRAGEGAEPSLSPLRVWPILLIVGLYGGLVQAGVGYLILAGLTFGLRMSLVEANVLKVVLVFAYTPIALAIFIHGGMVDLWLGLLLSVGQAVGGWLGAAAALSRGERLIRAVLAVAVIASAVKLLWG